MPARVDNTEWSHGWAAQAQETSFMLHARSLVTDFIPVREENADNTHVSSYRAPPQHHPTPVIFENRVSYIWI